MIKDLQNETLKTEELNSMNPSQIQKPKKLSSLELADQMWKDAFLVKKTKFALANPLMTEAEILKLTANYFKNLHGHIK